MSTWVLRGGVAVGLMSVAVVLIGTSSQTRPLSDGQHPRGPRQQGNQRRAVVLGATGATGRKVVLQLLESNDWHVTALVRKAGASDSGGPRSERLTEVVVGDMMELADVSVFRGHDVLFNCIGTTRAGGHSPSGRRDTGGAKAFIDVEVGLTSTASRLAAEAGVKIVAVVTSEGASAELFKGATWIEYIHPLLYMRTMGEKEQAVLDAGFERVSIFRPGLLHRQTGGFFEKIQDLLGFGSLKVETLAAAMIRDAEADTQPGSAKRVLYYQGNSYIAQTARL